MTSDGWPKTLASITSVVLLGFGLWAMAGPASFYDTVATFDPYNRHFVQDIGAFQIGLGAVLALAVAAPSVDALSVALLGVGAGSAAHLVSHLLGLDLGGSPATDVPLFAILSGALLWTGAARLRNRRITRA